MNILFVHQNMPGQFKHLAPFLAAQGHRVAFLTKRENVDLPGVERVNYPAPPGPAAAAHPFAMRYDGAVRFGERAANRLAALAADGFVPDLIVGHSGWGETLFLREVCPAAKLIVFSEFYYRNQGADVGFDPGEPPTRRTRFRSHARNAHLLLALQDADAIVSPTHWQKGVHPAMLHERIEVIFDGIETAKVRPDPDARVTLADGRVLAPGDKVVTYVARNLEPYRGFPTFMRAIAGIQARHPDVDILAIGGDEVSYGSKPRDFATWRAAMMAEVSFDERRVHWLGKLPYGRYLDVLRVSAAHIYLTYPFVLSWSCFEALAAGALVIGSDTAPVREVIEPGVNGLLTDFFDADALAARVGDVLDAPGRFASLRAAGRDTIVSRYATARCLAQWQALIERVAPPRRARRVYDFARRDAASLLAK